MGDEDASPVGEVEEPAEAEDPVEEEAEDNIEAREVESEESAEEPEIPEEGEAETVGGSPVSSTCPAVGTPLTSPPPVASFLGLVPTKKASKKSPPTTAKIRNPIFLLSGTSLP